MLTVTAGTLETPTNIHPVRVEGFDVFYDGMPLAEIRELTDDEVAAIEKQLGSAVLLGKAGLFFLVVVLPFLWQLSAQLHWKHSDALFRVGVQIIAPFAIVGLFQFKLSRRLRLPNFEVYVFRDTKKQLEARYLPGSKLLLNLSEKGKLTGGITMTKSLVRVAPVPAERDLAPTPPTRAEIAALYAPESLTWAESLWDHKPEEENRHRTKYYRLTETEIREIAETLKGNTFRNRFFRPVNLPFSSGLHYKEFFKALATWDGTVYRVQNGDEYLSTGVVWTEGGKPAAWRYEELRKRVSPVVRAARR